MMFYIIKKKKHILFFPATLTPYQRFYIYFGR